MEMHTREATLRALFQARKVIIIHWKSKDPPTVMEWVKSIGELLRMEKRIYQHRGNAYKFERVWAQWLDVPGRLDLTMDRLLRLTVG